MLFLFCMVVTAVYVDYGGETRWPSKMTKDSIYGNKCSSIPTLRHGLNMQQVLSIDTDLDGINDLVMAGEFGQCESQCVLQGVVHLGKQSGSFGGLIRFPPSMSVTASCALAELDYDLDGLPDVLYRDIVAPLSSTVLRGLGNGSFATVPAALAGVSLVVAATHSLATNDLNGDGRTDVTQAGRLLALPYTFNVLVSRANGSFVDESFRFGSDLTAVRSAPGVLHWMDVDDSYGDDLVSLGRFELSESASPGRVHLQLLNGSFGGAQFVGGEWNGYIRSVVANLGGPRMAIFASVDPFSDGFRTAAIEPIGNGTFAAPTVRNITNLGSRVVESMHVADLDRDGYDDLVIAGTYWPSIPFLSILYRDASEPYLFEEVSLLEGNVSQIDGPARPGIMSGRLGSTSSVLAVLGEGSPPYMVRLISGPRSPGIDITDAAAADGPSVADLVHSSVVLRDLNGDGCDDVVFCGQTNKQEPSANLCDAYRSTCDGSFEPFSDTTLPGSTRGSLLAADFDLDGQLDLFIVGSTGISYEVATTTNLLLSRDNSAWNVNSWTSNMPATSAGTYASIPWVVFDLDGDVAPDLMSVSYTYFAEDGILVWRNIGNGTFTSVPARETFLPAPPSGSLREQVVVVADWSGDAMADIFTPKSIGVFRALGNRSWVLDTTLFPGTGSSEVPVAVAGDFDGSGRTDLVALTNERAWVAAFHNGTSLVSAAFPVEIGSPAVFQFTLRASVVALDADGLGGTDLILSQGVDSSEIATLYLLLGLVNQSFEMVPDAFRNNAARDYPSSAFGDINSDGLDDAVFFGLGVFPCVEPSIFLREERRTSTTTTTGSTNDGDGSLGPILGGILGGGGIALLMLCAAALCVCLVCLVLAVVIVLVVFVAVVVLCVVVGVGGTLLAAVVGGGSTMGAVLLREKGYSECSVSVNDVVKKMEETEDFRHISFDEVRKGKRIGRGAYGSVFVAEWAGVKVALKVVSSPGGVQEAMLRAFEREALMMAKVSHHPNIVQMLGACVDGDDSLALVLRYYSRGPVDVALRSGKLPNAAKYQVLSEVASALAFLHSIPMVHLDVAARNVLLGPGNRAALGDFGMSRVLSSDEQRTKSDVGPVRWMPPEALKDMKYSAATDAWSFGVLMWEVWSDGATPYGEMKSVADVATAIVREGKRLVPPADCPSEHASLIRNLLVTDPADRPSMQDVHQQLARLSSTIESAAELSGAQPDASDADEYFAAEDLVQNNADEYVEADELVQ